MKLNLGSNTKRYDGFLNVDIRAIPGVDLVDDVTKLAGIEDWSVEAIVAHNILEHIASDKTMSTLRLWVSKLKTGGWIEIGVPDGELIFQRHLNHVITRREYVNNPWANVIHSIFGNIQILRNMHGDDAEKYMHHTLFCPSFLQKCMEDAGLGHIRRVRANHKDNITLRGIKEVEA